jgi:hypothetical protein
MFNPGGHPGGGRDKRQLAQHIQEKGQVGVFVHKRLLFIVANILALRPMNVIFAPHSGVCVKQGKTAYDKGVPYDVFFIEGGPPCDLN